MNVILGSGSKARKILFEQITKNFLVTAADINERAIRDSDPNKLVQKLALEKAEALAPTLQSESFLVTADTVVYCNNMVREKPLSKDEAVEMLTDYSNHVVTVHSGVSVRNLRSGVSETTSDEAAISFRPILFEAMRKMVHDDVMMHVAGCIAIEHPLMFPFVERIDGLVDTVLGLPVKKTRQMLKNCGYRVD